MSRRVALARAIALDPDLLMYDEPFTGQDPIAMGVLLTLIKNLNLALRTTNIVVSHDIHETSTIADQLYVIADGRVIGAGTPAELQANDSELIRQFMHGRPDGPVPFHFPAPDIARDLLERAR
jgi:phospholipid/cholesterol/gamma-HCH transport system ATP-binding protein